jgi:hypothetical protein
LDVIGAFIVGINYKELVHELGHKSPASTSELLDLATNFACREEAVVVIFPGTRARGSRRRMPLRP